VNIIDTVRSYAIKILETGRGSHDWEHTERVYSLALRIAKKEGADREVVSIASLLHDIARHEEDESGGKICHAKQGARKASVFLESQGLPPDFVAKVAHCIESHRYRGSVKPASLEARVLFDADKLDSIGAVGIGRAFLFAGEIGAKLHNKRIDIAATEPYTIEDTAYREYAVKLRFVKDSMLTAEGKRLAMERHEYMVVFFERLDAEVDGSL
jgi:uncharacterized protein